MIPGVVKACLGMDQEQPGETVVPDDVNMSSREWLPRRAPLDLSDSPAHQPGILISGYDLCKGSSVIESSFSLPAKNSRHAYPVDSNV